MTIAKKTKQMLRMLFTRQGSIRVNKDVMEIFPFRPLPHQSPTVQLLFYCTEYQKMEIPYYVLNMDVFSTQRFTKEEQRELLSVIVQWSNQYEIPVYWSLSLGPWHSVLDELGFQTDDKGISYWYNIHNHKL